MPANQYPKNLRPKRFGGQTSKCKACPELPVNIPPELPVKNDPESTHMSTMRKVEMIDRIITLEEKAELIVAVSIIKSCGLSPTGIIEIVRNNWILFTMWSIIMAILGMALEPVIQRLFGTGN